MAHRRGCTFHQVEQELQRIAIEGRRAARVTTEVLTAEPAQIEALIARMDQQQQTINDLNALTRSLANMFTTQQCDAGDAEVDVPPAT